MVAGRVNILSLQSWVCCGHVGNAAALFSLQRLGAEVWAVNTVQFSNHPGHGGWTGRVLAGEAVRALLDGIEARGVLASCDGVLSDYLGGRGAAEAVLEAPGRVRARNPDAVYCCDPVIGDAGSGVYVRAGVAELIRDRGLPLADLATPNQFELEYLTGCACATLADAKAAVTALQARLRPGGAGGVLVTGLRTEATPADAIDMLAAAGGACFLLRTPRLALAASGAGDVTAALFLFHWLRQGGIRAALEATGSSVFGLARRTAEAGSRELLIVAAQEEFVAPGRRFTAVAC